MFASTRRPGRQELDCRVMWSYRPGLGKAILSAHLGRLSYTVAS
jgi:hypothetical protein